MFSISARRQVPTVAGFSSRLLGSRHRSRISTRYYSQEPARYTTKTQWKGPVLVFIGTFTAASLLYAFREKYVDLVPTVKAPSTPEKVIITKPKTESTLSTERNRDQLSPQHVQVTKGRESPGVYAWGSNSSCVADPDSSETVIKTPRRLRYFEGKILRDLKLDQASGAAISETGDLIQWGKGYSQTEFQPTPTLTGKDLVSICMSRDRIIALSSGGDVYSLPIAKLDQQNGPKLLETSFPFWRSRAKISYRPLVPRLGLGERVSSITGGLEHVLLLTNCGRVFSAAAATEAYPSRGQLGIPGLTWATRPQGPVDRCHEISSLRGFRIVQIASGDSHSLVLDKDGRVFVFGDNSFGQLGLELEPMTPIQDTPTLLPLSHLYSAKNWLTKVTGVAAGGANSFITVDAQRVHVPDEHRSAVQNPNAPTVDTWAFGKGIHGALGTGRWTHIQDTPSKVKTLSGLFEFDDKTQKITPIRLNHISVGSTHAAAVLNNRTHLNAPDRSSFTDTNWGQDVLWWGGNEFFQLGTGKRNNVPVPTYIRPPADVQTAGDTVEARFQIIPRQKGRVGNRKITMEQRIECGRNVSAVYSAV